MVKDNPGKNGNHNNTGEDVLTLILIWLKRNDFSPEDQKEAENIWRRYLKSSKVNSKNARILAAAVIYYLGKIRGYKWMNQSVLAEAFSVSPGSISQHWQEISKTFRKDENRANAGGAALSDFFNPVAAEVFRKLMSYTQRSERWKSYVGDIFFKYVGTEAPPLPIDLILELLIFITCDRTLPDGKKIIDFFLEEEGDEFTLEEKEFLRSIRASRFSLFEVKALREGSWLEVEDLYRDVYLKLFVKDHSGIDKGDIIMSRIIPSAEQNTWKIGGNLVTLRPPAVRELEELAHKWFWEFSVANKGWATGEEFIQENSFRFWRWLLGH